MYINDNPTQPNFTFTVLRKLEKILVRIVSAMKPLLTLKLKVVDSKNAMDWEQFSALTVMPPKHNLL